MVVAARRHLRRMSNHQHLQPAGQPRQPLAHRIRRGAADIGVDLVEDQGRHVTGFRRRHFQRQHDARQLAARRNLAQRPFRRAGIGGDQKGDSVDAVGCPGGFLLRLNRGNETRLVQLQGGQFHVDRAVQPGCCFLARRRQLRRLVQIVGPRLVFRLFQPFDGAAAILGQRQFFAHAQA